MSDIGGGQPNKDDQVTSGVSTGENAVETVDATKCADFLVVANRLPPTSSLIKMDRKSGSVAPVA